MSTPTIKLPKPQRYVAVPYRDLEPGQWFVWALHPSGAYDSSCTPRMRTTLGHVDMKGRSYEKKKVNYSEDLTYRVSGPGGLPIETEVMEDYESLDPGTLFQMSGFTPLFLKISGSRSLELPHTFCEFSPTDQVVVIGKLPVRHE